MPWFKVDEGFPEHPKVDALGPLEDLCLALWLKVGCLSNRRLLEGRVPVRRLDALMRLDGVVVDGTTVTMTMLIEALVRAGLWHLELSHVPGVVPGDMSQGQGTGDSVIVIHDYHSYQPSRGEVQNKREYEKTRKAAYRRRLAEKRAMSPGTSAGTTAGTSAGTPTGRPAGSPTHYRSRSPLTDPHPTLPGGEGRSEPQQPPPPPRLRRSEQRRLALLSAVPEPYECSHEPRCPHRVACSLMTLREVKDGTVAIEDVQPALRKQVQQMLPRRKEA